MLFHDEYDDIPLHGMMQWEGAQYALLAEVAQDAEKVSEDGLIRRAC